MSNRKFTPQEWDAHFDAQEKSGQSIIGYCEPLGISPATFSSAKQSKKKRQTMMSEPPKFKPKTSAEYNTAIVRLERSKIDYAKRIDLEIMELRKAKALEIEMLKDAIAEWEDDNTIEMEDEEYDAYFSSEEEQTTQVPINEVQ